MQRTTLTLAAAIALGLLLSPTQAKMYRWVDADGNVHYSDKIPTDQVDQARDELNKQGVGINRTPRAKTAEELAKEQELERLRLEQQRLIEEQQASDRVLLRTFRSEDDILLARDGKLAAIDVMIQVTQSNIRRNQAKLAQLQERAANLERAGRQVPDKLLANINTTLRNINDGYTAIDKKEQEKQAVRDTFGLDLKRFRELKNIRPKPEQIAREEQRKELDNLVHCKDEQACDAAWAKAETFLRTHATTPMQMLGGRILMSAAPKRDDDISITISRLKRPEQDATLLFMDLYCRDTPRGKELCDSDKVKAIRQTFLTDVGGL